MAKIEMKKVADSILKPTAARVLTSLEETKESMGQGAHKPGHEMWDAWHDVDCACEAARLVMDQGSSGVLHALHILNRLLDSTRHDLETVSRFRDALESLQNMEIRVTF